MNSEFWKGKKILLTGHTGFKGSWLCIWLKKLNASIVGYSKSIPTTPSLFELANVEKEIISITGDICDLPHLEDVIRKHRPQIIINMAAQSLVHESYKNPVDTYLTNVMGSVNLFEAVRRNDTVRVVINVTSDKCYENTGKIEGYKEEDPIGGYDPYSSSKGCAELITSSFRNSFFNTNDFEHHHTAIASVRAGNVIGGGDWARDRIIPDIVRAITENKILKIRNLNAVRPWQHVLEPLNGYLLLAENLWKDGSSYSKGWNFGPGDEDIKPVSWIIEKFSQFWGKNIAQEINNNSIHEAQYLKLDCTNAKNNLGWKPKMNLEMAIKWTVDWYKQFEQNADMAKITEEQIIKYSSL